MEAGGEHGLAAGSCARGRFQEPGVFNKGAFACKTYAACYLRLVDTVGNLTVCRVLSSVAESELDDSWDHTRTEGEAFVDQRLADFEDRI